MTEETEILEQEPIYRSKDGQVVTHSQLRGSGYTEDNIKSGIGDKVLELVGDTQNPEQEFESKDKQRVTTKDLLSSGYTQQNIDEGVRNGILSPLVKKKELGESGDLQSPSNGQPLSGQEGSIPLVNVEAPKDFQDTPEGNSPAAEDPISQAIYAGSLANKTKEYSSVTGGMGQSVSNIVPDTDSQEYSKAVKEKIKAAGYDPDRLANDFTGIPENIYAIPIFSKATLLADYKDNPQLYERKVSTIKSQLDIRNELLKNEGGKELYAAVQNAYRNSSTGNYDEKRANLKSIIEVVNEYGGDSKEKILKNIQIDFSPVYGKAAAEPGEFANDPLNAVLNSNQLAAYRLLEDTQPEILSKYKAALLDDNEIKENFDAKLGKQEARKQLDEIGRGLVRSFAQEKINEGKKEYDQLLLKSTQGEITEGEQQRILELEGRMQPYRQMLANADEDEGNDAQRYPMASRLDALNFAQEVLGQRNANVSWFAAEMGKATDNTVTGVMDFISRPFLSEKENEIHQAEILGDDEVLKSITYLQQSNQTTKTFKPELSPELQSDIDVIKNDNSLSDAQKRTQVEDLLVNRMGEWRRTPIAGGETNIGIKSMLYGVGGLTANLAPFIALEFATGGGATAGALRKLTATFASAAATGFHDSYVAALERGSTNPYKDAFITTAINSAALAGAGTPAAIRKMLTGGGNRVLSKLVSSMTDDAIEAALKKSPEALSNLQKALQGAKKAGSVVGEATLEGAKGGAKITAFTTGGQVLNDIIHNEVKTPQEYAQGGFIEALKFTIFGAAAGSAGRGIQRLFKKPTNIGLAALYELGSRPEVGLEYLKKMEANGEISANDAAQVKSNINKAASIYAKSDILKDASISDNVKREYLYNKMVEADGKEQAASLPPKAAAESQKAAEVAAHKNDILLEQPTDKRLEARKAQLEKQLIPEKDSEGKEIPVNEKLKQETEAELTAVNEVLEERSASQANARAKPLTEQRKNEIGESKVSVPTTKAGIDAINDAISRKEELKEAGFEFSEHEDNPNPTPDTVAIGNVGIRHEYHGKGLGTAGYILKGEEYLRQGRYLVSEAREGRTEQATGVWKKLVKLGLAEETSPGSYKYGNDRLSESTASETNIPLSDSEAIPNETHESVMRRAKTGEPIQISAWRIQKSDGINEKTGGFFADKGITDEYQRRQKSGFYGKGNEGLFEGDVTPYNLSFKNPLVVESKEQFIKDLAEAGDKEAREVMPNYKEADPAKFETTHKTYKDFDEFIAKKAREKGFDGIITPLEYVALGKDTFVNTSKKSESITGDRQGESEAGTAVLEKNISEFKDLGEGVLISHDRLQDLADDFGLKKVESRDPVSDKQEAENAFATAKKWNEEGKYGENIEKLLLNIEKGEGTNPTEKNILQQHIANVREQAKGMDIMSKEYDAKLEELERLKTAGAKIKSIAGANLRNSTIESYSVPTMADWMADRKQSLNVEELTPEQKEQTAKLFEDYETKLKAETDKNAEAQTEISKLKAELALKSERQGRSTVRKKNREALSREREDIWKSIKDKLKQSKTETTATVLPYAKELFTIAPDVAKLTRNLLEDGYSRLEEIVDVIHGKLKDAITGITKKDVQDIIAGEYTEKKATRSELDKQLADLKAEARRLNKEDELLAKELEKEIGSRASRKRKADQSTSKEVEKGLDYLTPEETQLEAMKKRNQKSIEEIEKKIKNKDFETKKTLAFDENAALKKVNPKLWKEVQDSRIALQDAKDKFQLEKQKDALRQTDWRAVGKYLTEDGWRAKLKGMGLVGLNLFRAGKKIISTSKAIKAGIDDSITFVQLGMAVAANPRSAIKAKYEAFKDINPTRFRRELAALHESPIWPLIEKSKLNITEPKSLFKENSEELYSGNLLDQKIGGKVNIWTNTGGVFERLFTSMGNNIRLNLFKKRVEYLESNGKTIESHPEEYKAAARVINEMTARGEMQPAIRKVMDIASPIIWAPKMLASSVNILGLGEVSGKGYYRALTPLQRTYALSQLGKGVGVGVAVMAALGGAGWGIDYNPQSATFGMVTSPDGKRKYNVFGRFGSLAKTVTQLATGKKINQEGKETNLDAKGGRASVLGKFTRGKFTPAAGVAYDLWLNGQRNSFTGKDINLESLPNDLLTPISIGDMAQGFKNDGAQALLTRWLPAIEGIQVMDSRDFMDTDLPSLLDRNVRSEDQDVSEIKNFKAQGRKITKGEADRYKKERDAVITKKLTKLFKDGTPLIRDGKIVKVPYASLTKQEVQDETARLKAQATREVKVKLFGKDKTSPIERKLDRVRSKYDTAP